MHNSSITFYGGTETVTGSNFLFEDEKNNLRILVDCGFFQGRKIAEDQNREPFPYDPASIDVLFVTHGHIDHVGRIPRLVREGFRGKIYSTEPTKDIAELMLLDSLRVLEKEAHGDNLPLIYEAEDVKQTMEFWHTVAYHEPVALSGGITATLKDAGHILGSAMIVLERDGQILAFTGDLGNSPAPLLNDTETLSGATYVVMESIYGDRNHESRERRKEILEDVIEDAAQAGGVLMVPAFSLERTQELLFEINDLVEHGRIMPVPVYLDSPLAIDVTKVYKKHEKFFNHATMDIIKNGDDVFKFPNLKFTKRTEESKAIGGTPNPKVIIAGSGMSNGGRIIHHEKRYLSDPKSTLLLIGYQAAGTMGRMIEDGAKEVTILGTSVPVRARIVRIRGYSAHKDSDALVDFVHGFADSVKRVFVTIGEPRASMYLSQRLRDYLGINATVPKKGERVAIDF